MAWTRAHRPATLLAVQPLLTPYLLDQSGVVSRRQVLEAGLRPHDLARLVRRRELTPLHPGVFVEHTGEPTWLQRAWGGVLLCSPAALSHTSALRAVEGPGSRREDVIHLVVAHGRSPTTPPGVVARGCRHLDERVQWHTGPPRVRYDEAVLDVASRASSGLAVLDELAKAVQGRRTTADRLLVRLAARSRIPRRGWMQGVLEDVAGGVCSVLEHGYLTRVERPHGLTGARRQVRDRVGAGVIYRDVEYAGGFVVELDGRLFHDTARQRDRDLDRDLVSAVDGKDTVRLGYGQVFDRSCWTAGHVGVLLGRRGWPGRPRPCGPGCPVGR
jgi:hypothetical protein